MSANTYIYTYTEQRIDTKQSGNVFFYILLGVALFAALSFAVSRGMRGQTSTALSERQIDLAVSEILTEAQGIETAINRLRRHNISENEICFEHNLISSANNNAYASLSSCSEDTYKLYHPNGGDLSFRKLPEDWLDASHSSEQCYGEWMFSNVNGVDGIGESTMSDASSMELIAFIPHLKKKICTAINKKLGIGSSIPDNSSMFSPDPVDDGFVSTAGEISVSDLYGEYSGCFENGNTWNSYIFYRVLIER